MDTFANRVETIIETAWKVRDWDEYDGWNQRVTSFLAAAIDAEAADKFFSLRSTSSNYWRPARDRQIGHLEGLILRIESSGLSQAKAATTPEITESQTSDPKNRRVFLVHGHDAGAKESAARFLEKIRLEPVILHEQANEGRTVIEKFEAHVDVGFAIVLLTPDDLGASVEERDQLAPRARQNVILELGYFTGKLGRSRVCALYKSGVEVPSDFHGVLFIELDQAGAWKTKLAQELVKAGIQIDIHGLLQS